MPPSGIEGYEFLEQLLGIRDREDESALLLASVLLLPWAGDKGLHLSPQCKPDGRLRNGEIFPCG